MKIQFNTDSNITESKEFRASLIALISEGLSRFSDQISRLEVHLSDENSLKKGLNDKRCLLEARLEGRQPIAVKNQANNLEQAVVGAVDKLKASLDTKIGRSRNY